MGPKPVNNSDKFCIALAFGYTDIPLRMGEDDFKRFPMDKISPAVNSVAQAVRLAPSSFNSQPWMLGFDDGKVVVKECGRGLMRVMLRGRLNKIDVGIAARHAVTTFAMRGMTLEEMKNVDIRTVDPVELVDIRDVKVFLEQSREARIMDFVAQVRNPYCFKVGRSPSR